MNSNNSITKNALLNIIYTLSNILFPIITFPYITRVLSVNGVGQVYFYQSIATYATMIASLGIGTYGIRATAKVRNDREKLSRVVEELMIINLIMTTIVVMVITLLSFFVEEFKSNYALLWINCISIVSNVVGLNWLYSGLEQYEYITKRSLLFKGISILLMFLLVKKPDDYIAYAAITVFSTAGSNLLNMYNSRKFVSFKRYNSYNFGVHFKPMLILFSSLLAVSVYTNLDTIMLGFIKGSTEVGVFTVATKIKLLLLNLVNAISTALLPRLSFYVNEGKIDKYKLILRNASSIVLTIAIPTTIYFMFYAKESIYFISGSGYSSAVLPMQIIMPVLVISGFSNIVGNQVLIPNNLEKFFMYAVICGSIIDFVLNIILMPAIGSVGAAIATLFAEVAQMAIQTYCGREYLNGNIEWIQIVKVFLAALVGVLLSRLLTLVIGININVAIVLVSGIAFLLFFVIVLYLLKDSVVYVWVSKYVSFKE